METAKVSKIPECNFCVEFGNPKPAKYDGKTIFRVWAYMCEEHFKKYGIGLGLGKGQRLILERR